MLLFPFSGLCLVEHESRYTYDIENHNSDHSTDYGIFQLNNKYWCDRPSGYDGTICWRLNTYGCQYTCQCKHLFFCNNFFAYIVFSATALHMRQLTQTWKIEIFAVVTYVLMCIFAINDRLHLLVIYFIVMCLRIIYKLSI